MQRPTRIRIQNESGQLQSLPDGKQYFQDLGGNGPVLMLGLGPDPAFITQLFSEEEHIYFIECPEIEKQLPTIKELPSKFKKISPEHIEQYNGFHIFIYLPGKKLFPSFWGPVLSKVVLKKAGTLNKTRSKTAWLPGDGNSLLVPELSRALAGAGFSYRVIDPDAMCNNLLSLLDNELPELVISVNFNGLDSSGETYFMLREAGIKVLVWIVDNPFHVISGIRSEYWKQVPLMVTDHWFIPRLKELGALNAAHLPLATDPEIFNPDVKRFPAIENRVVFVGRSSFPDKKSFFSGCSFTRQNFEDATTAIESGIKPDFDWWARHYNISKLYPGKEIRKTGFRAEQSGLLWRTTALKEVGNRLTLFGDDGWKDFLHNGELRGPVDYFTVLPTIYAGAGLTMNLTSPLLPCGLTQRNFDVWAAGGMLLSDKTEGMSIFPDELVNECTFSAPPEIPALCDKFLTLPNLVKTLSKIWHQLIIKEHTYKNRIDNILNFIT